MEQADLEKIIASMAENLAAVTRVLEVLQTQAQNPHGPPAPARMTAPMAGRILTSETAK